MKKYLDIARLKKKYLNKFEVGDKICVTEKVDGANASFTYDPVTNETIAFSRNKQLDSSNTLRGFYEWTQQLDQEIVRDLTDCGRYIIFGEWLVPHTVHYPEQAYNKFYMFDIYDTVKKEYMPQDFTWGKYYLVRGFDSKMEFVPRLYSGNFTNWEMLMDIVGTTKLGAEPCGEGIVIKNQSKLNSENSYIKIVSSQFSEVKGAKKVKEVSPEDLAKKKEEEDSVKTIVTRRRVEKILEKLVDEGIITENWDEKDLGIISKNITKLVYEDCRKEEPEVVLKNKKFGKICAKVTMGIVKEILSER